MERFTQLFGNLLVFVYHCFDRIVINGYLNGLSRPEQVVHFVREVLGTPVVSKEVLNQRTHDYQSWVEAYARNHKIPFEWAGKGVRKENHVWPHCARMERKKAFGVYSHRQEPGTGPDVSGSACRSIPLQDTPTASWRIRISRFTHYYFYIRDEVLGPIIIRVSSFFPFHARYWLNGHSFMERELKRGNLGFHKNDNAFLAVNDGAALQAAFRRHIRGSSANNWIIRRSSWGRSSPRRNAPR